MLVQLRFEVYSVLASFKKDTDDEDLQGIPKDLFILIKDIVVVKDGMVICQLSDENDDLSIFVKLTEEQRRERQRRIDAGDEMVRLKFTAPPKPQPKAEPKPAAPKAAVVPNAAAAPKAETKPDPKAKAAA